MMKRTTKILIGLLLSGFLGSIIATTLTFLMKKSQVFVMEGKPVQMDLSSFRVLAVSVESDGKLKKSNLWFSNDLTVLPAQSGKNVLTFPADMRKFLSVVMKNDTLLLSFKMLQQNLPDAYKHRNWMTVAFSGFTLSADSLLATVDSRDVNMLLRLKKREADSLTVTASDFVVDSCRLRSLLVPYANKMNLEKSCIANLYLDLDGMWKWNVNNCEIENEHLTGSKSHNNQLNKGECRRVYWKPKEKDAQLNIQLNEECCLLLKGEENDN